MKLIKNLWTGKLKVVQISLVFLLLYINHASAQDSYIITLPGDTLMGDIVFGGIQSNVETLYFTATGKSRKTYLATGLRGFHSDSFDYITVKNQVYRFMKVLKDGYLKILSFRPLGSQTFNSTLLYKLDGEHLEVSRFNFKNTMADFLEDCNVVSVRIKNKELQWRDLEEIVDLYNDCIEDKTSKPLSMINPATTSDEAISATEQIGNSQMPVQGIIDDLKITYRRNGVPFKDFIAIIDDVEEKIKAQETVPSYLIQALRSSVSESGDMVKLVDKLESGLNEADLTPK